MKLRDGLKGFLAARTLWLSLAVPVLLLPLPVLNPGQVAACAYCVLVIGIYWVTEVIPLAVTSLLPIVLFPLLGVMSAKDTCSSYAKDTLMLFMGSLMVAVAVERWGLHRRLALRTLCLVGPQPKWLMLGIMLPCWFLSMWMSNTATAAMMMPIVNAILEQIRLTRTGNRSVPLEEVEVEVQADGRTETKLISDDRTKEKDLTENGNLLVDPESNEEPDPEFTRLSKAFSLCVAFSANVGGMATLTGTPPNIIFKGQIDILKPKEFGASVNFANWMVIGVPVSAILFLFVWFWLYLYTVRSKLFTCRKDEESYEGVRRILRQEADSLGRMTFPEMVVLINFIILALLWVTRKPGFIPGWDNLLPEKFSGDSIPAILIGVILFILPAKSSIVSGFGTRKVTYDPILTWKNVHEKMAWGVLLLMGGGFAVADACQRSGLSKWVSSHLIKMADLDPWVINLVLTIIISLATQVTSNAATATLFLPIVGDLAISLGIHPLYFMIPTALSTSLAFLLPVATPPNAIAFAAGYLKVADMVLTGSVINIVSLIVVNVAINTIAWHFYDLDALPVSPVIIVNETVTLASSMATGLAG